MPRLALNQHSLFLAALGFFLLMHWSLQGTVMVLRGSPVEPDDAYGYIVKSARLLNPPESEVAFRDLRTQLQPDGQPYEVERAKWKAFHRLYVHYHPLYSVALCGLRLTGMSWEAAYNVLILGGVLLIGVGAGIFLSSLFGWSAGALALFFIALYKFPKQGLHYIVPGNMCLGAALLLWGLLLLIRHRRHFLLLPGILILLTLHSTGKLYAALALALYAGIAWQDRTNLRRDILQLAAAAFLLATSFILPQLIDEPLLRAAPPPVPDTGAGLVKNFSEALRLVYKFTLRHLPLLIAGVLSLSSLAKVLDWKRTALFHTAVLMLLALGFVHVFPGYPAELFSRVWVLVALILIGLATAAVLRNQGCWTRRLLLLQLAVTLIFGSESLVSLARDEMIGDDPIVLDEEPWREWRERIEPHALVFYQDEISMTAALSYGLQSRHAIYGPAADALKSASDPDGLPFYVMAMADRNIPGSESYWDDPQRVDTSGLAKVARNGSCILFRAMPARDTTQ